MWFDGMEDMLKENNKADYTIHTKPYKINLICPHCNIDIHINGNESEYWDNIDWGSISCPCCGCKMLIEWQMNKENYI